MRDRATSAGADLLAFAGLTGVLMALGLIWVWGGIAGAFWGMDGRRCTRPGC